MSSHEVSWGAVATLVGCIVGAGIFAVPYAVASAGYLTGIATIVLLGLITLVVNLYLGEICLRTGSCNQLSGYARRYLGKHGAGVMRIAMLVGINGGLIAYILGEGEALFEIFGVLSPGAFSLIFFFVMAFIVYRGINALERTELLLVPVIILLMVLIAVLARDDITLTNLADFSIADILMPYGVVLFAYSGVYAIPEMREELLQHESSLKKSIIAGTLIPMGIYLVFASLVVGVTGADTTQVATIGLGQVIGPAMVWIGNLFVVCAMATSFLALGFALKGMYMHDFNLSNTWAWGLTMLVPCAIAFSGLTDFINAVEFTGAFGTGIIAILSLFMVHIARYQGDREPEYSFPKHYIFTALLIGVFVLGLLYQLLQAG